MKFQPFAVRNSLLILAALVTFCFLNPEASAQEKSSPEKKATPAAKFPAAKRQAPEPSSADADADFESALDADKEESGKEKDAAKATKTDKDGPNAIRKREEWFYKQRSSANGHIPAGARVKALEHMQRRLEAEGRLVRRADGSFAEVAPRSTAVTPFAMPVTNTWSSIGPTPTAGGFFSPVTGRITTIAIDPTDATGNTLLIGGALGGIWRSTNAGASWTAEGDQDPSLAMGSIAFAPSAPATVYAGTGEQASIGFDIYYGAGVLKSTNGGQTWTQTCTTAGPTCPFIGPYSNATPFGFFTLGGTRISYVAVNPTNPAMVLVGAQTQFAEGPTEGVYCSSDSGGTWSLVAAASGEMSTFVGFASPTVAFAALGNPFGSKTGKNGIYKSTNANSCALTFSALTTGLPPENTMGRIDMGISPLFATDNTIYASIADGTNQSSPNLGVWVTTNGGTSWTLTTAPDICTAQCWYDNVVKVDPNGGAHAFFGGSAVSTGSGPIWVVRTANTGASWSSIVPAVTGPGLPHVDNHAMAFIKLSTGKIRMYLGNDGGIWRTDDAEATSVTWTNLNNSPLTLTQFYPALSIHPSSQAVAFAGAQDNGSQIYLGPPGLAWNDNGICGDGTGTAIDNVFPSTVYVSCNGLNLAVSTQNGQPNTFLTAVNGINPGDNSSFVPPFVTDPSTANTVYAGSTKVYQSVNTGNSWTALSGDLVNGASPIFDNLSALAVAPGNSKVMYTGANTGQVFVATNVAPGTGAFAQVTGQASLPPRQVSAISVDPNVATGLTAYAAFSGFAFGSDLKGHLFKTADGGATWTDVSCTVASCLTPAASDLPNTPVNDVVIDPDISGTLYAATDIGVYQGTCTTTCTWSPLSTGLPRSAVLSLKLHHASRTLRAATHGRGAWDIVLNNFTFPGPHISSITPVSAPAGTGASIGLTVNGNGLLGGAVQWNGATTGVTQGGGGTDTTLTATIAPSLTGGGGAPQITVKTAAGTSNPLTFTVLGSTPTITSVSPTNKPVNSPTTQITVTGTGFASNATVLMNPDVGGTAIPTTFVSTTQLTAMVPASFMANFGSTNSVGVQNPPPGGGTTTSGSNPVALPTFVVVAPAPINDNFASAINITSTTFADTKDSSGATSQTNDPPPATVSACVPNGSGLANTIWYKVAPTGTGLANIDTIGSSYDSVLSVWSGTSQSALTAVACNDDINPGIVTVSQLTGVTLNAGTTYFIMVSSFGALDPNPIAFGGKSILNFAFTGTIGGNPAPTITSLSPNNTAAGGTSFVLNVTGTNFVAGATVNFGANPALTPSAITPTLITVTVPAGDIAAAGTPGVTVTTVGGTSNSVTFTINAAAAAPTITTISPTSATAGGAAFPLTINGTNFVAGATVNFGANPALTPTSIAATQIMVTIPAGDIATAGTPGVTVTTGGGTSNSVTFTINSAANPVPTITTISPTSATAGGAAFTLTINGTNFVGSSKVTFGTNAGLVPTSVTGTTIMVTIPASAIASAGTPVVIVTNPSPGGGPSNSVNFTVNPATTGTFTVTGTALTVATVAGQTATGTSTIKVTPSGTFGSALPVIVTCPTAPAGVTCSPLTITILQGTNPAPISMPLTVNVTGPSTTLSASTATAMRALYAASIVPSGGGKAWWMLSAGAGFGSIFLLFLPGRKRYRAALGLGLVCVLSFTLGCSSAGGGGTNPVATTTKVSVTSTKVPSGTNVALAITVTASVGANGQVQLFDGSTTLGAPVTVTNGSTTIMNALAVGTHSISAHYLGDSKTMASQSGTLNVTVTGGPVPISITTSPAATPAAPPINITIN
jgi:hypothetical protein